MYFRSDDAHHQGLDDDIRNGCRENFPDSCKNSGCKEINIPMNDTLPWHLDPITGFQRRYMSFGDMLGEWFYGFLMVAVVRGIIGGYSEILLESNLGYGRGAPHGCPAGTHLWGEHCVAG